MASQKVEQEWMVSFFCFDIKGIKANGPFGSLEACHFFLQGGKLFCTPK
jgi:hypothetical protein